MTEQSWDLCGRRIGLGERLFLIAGPCVIESEAMALSTAETLRGIADRLGILLIYKSSFDKANRSAGSSFRGPGLDEGLRILSEVLPTISKPRKTRAERMNLDTRGCFHLKIVPYQSLNR